MNFRVLLVLAAVLVAGVVAPSVKRKRSTREAGNKLSKRTTYTEDHCRKDFQAMITSLGRKIALPGDIQNIFRDKILYVRGGLALCKQAVDDVKTKLFELRDDMLKVWNTLDAYEEEARRGMKPGFNCGDKIEYRRGSDSYKYSEKGGRHSPIPVKADWFYDEFEEMNTEKLRRLCCATIDTSTKKCEVSKSMGREGFTFKRKSYALGRMLCHATFV